MRASHKNTLSNSIAVVIITIIAKHDTYRGPRAMLRAGRPLSDDSSFVETPPLWLRLFIEKALTRLTLNPKP